MQSTQPVPTTPTESPPPKPDLAQAPVPEVPIYQATPPQTADTRAMIPDEVAQLPTYQPPSSQTYAPQPTQYQPAPYQPPPYQPTPYQTTPPPQDQSWGETRYDDRTQRRIERRNRSQAAGVEVWGVLLILVGAIALVGNFGIGFGWIFGLALGAWFVYLGVRHVQAGQPVNWWLVGLGLLIGLGAISTGFVDQLIFPSVLVIVGLGILAEYVLNRQKKSQ